MFLSSISGVANSITTGEIRPLGPEWLRDKDVTECMDCGAKFTFVKRRHHCRYCGNIFCGSCSSQGMSLPQYGHHHPVRVCRFCWNFLNQQEMEKKEKKSEDPKGTNAQHSDVTISEVKSIVVPTQPLQVKTFPVSLGDNGDEDQETLFRKIQEQIQMNLISNTLSNTILLDFLQSLTNFKDEVKIKTVVYSLISSGIDPNGADCLGNTALHYLAKNPQLPISITEMILQKGTNLELKNHLGQTALHLSIASGNVQMVKTLCSLGCNVNAQDELGRTPLRIACSNLKEEGSAEIIEILLRFIKKK